MIERVLVAKYVFGNLFVQSVVFSVVTKVANLIRDYRYLVINRCWLRWLQEVAMKES